MGSLIRADLDHTATTPFRRQAIRFLEAKTVIAELPAAKTKVCAVLPPASSAQPPPIPPPRPRTAQPQAQLRLPPAKPSIELPPQPLPLDALLRPARPEASRSKSPRAAVFAWLGDRRYRMRRVAICLLAIACGIGFGIVSLRIANRLFGEPDREQRAATPTPSPTPSPTQSTPAPAPREIASTPTVCAPPPRPSTIRVRVTSRPSGATVYVDGEVVGTAPLDLALDRSDKPRALKLRRSGHHSESLTVVPDRDTDIHVRLQPRLPAS